ncbi:hypothetical protein D1B31_02145 [Neobacillus notoginsengisoli]|uniref:Uncharacterized protein n=1 Tax=Neobacillus notoginsengisoli TaxID=1578198 RepID=A0A417Z004_9BACI|nr:hypothetical protein D1B31_02145 [Neobacillus notoginsengisoli]
MFFHAENLNKKLSITEISHFFIIARTIPFGKLNNKNKIAYSRFPGFTGSKQDYRKSAWHSPEYVEIFIDKKLGVTSTYTESPILSLKFIR